MKPRTTIPRIIHYGQLRKNKLPHRLAWSMAGMGKAVERLVIIGIITAALILSLEIMCFVTLP